MMATKANESSKEVSLLEFLDLSQVNCLNESPEHTLKDILAEKTYNTTTKYLLSSADEQLLLNLHFNQAVRVRTLVITSSEISQAPKSVKIFANKPSIGFEDVEDIPESQVPQVLELTEEQVKEPGQQLPLRLVRFQNVTSLHIFIVTNQGDLETTRINAIDVFGIPVQTVKDLSGLRNTEG